MSFLGLWHESWNAALVNHLWQSTAVVVIAWLFTAVLKKNHARVRYWVWFAASVKFLLPFSLLIAAGEWLRSLVPVPAGQPAVASVIGPVTQPFGQTQFFDAGSAPIAAHHVSFWPLALFAVWLCGALFLAIRFGLAWAKMNAVKRRARLFELTADVPVLSSSASIEPGIFGVFRPVLLLPDGIPERLSAEQMRAILAHEMCHVRRRDNLTFVIHMVVETLFWFHPLVWWIGSRLVEERERACDQAVVEAGSKAQIYAEGILNVCKFYAEAPVACVAGVTGADLKKRIVRIMTEQVGQKLGTGRRFLLMTAGALAVATPLMLGLARAQNGPGNLAGMAEAPLDARNLPKFEVVSIKPHRDEGMKWRIGVTETRDEFMAGGLPLQMLIRKVFNLPANRVLNEPDWTRSARYDIQAKVAPEDMSKFNQLTDAQQWHMLLPVLEERFGLKFHHETRVLRVYTLEVAKGEVKMQLAKPLAPAGKQTPGQAAMEPASAGMRIGDNGVTITARRATMASLSSMISTQIGSTVIDRTGLTGSYDYTLQFAPDENMLAGMPPPPSSGSAPPPEAQAPSIFTAIKDQLGLQLVAAKRPVDVLVIDHVDHPSPN